MGKDSPELFKRREPVEIKVTKDAEDIIRKDFVADKIDRPYELNVVKQEDVNKMMNNPLVSREIRRRELEDSDDGEAFLLKLTDHNPHDVIEQAEKKWVGDSMERILNDAKKRKEDKEKAKQEEEIRKREEELKIREAEEKRKKEVEKDLQKKRLTLFTHDNLKFSESRLNVNIPEKTALLTGFGKKFKNSISDKKRRDKKRNKKSRLYQKIKNEENLNNNINSYYDTVYSRASKLVDKDTDISTEDLNDLAQFMIYRDSYKNEELSRLMLGGKNEDGKKCVDKYHAGLALVKMADQLLSIDLSGIKLDTDHDIAENAKMLESISGRVAAFSRLSRKYGFIEGLDNNERHALISKIEALESVAAYYNSRKELINNKLYKDHYNEELTMDISKAKNDEERALAEKLVRSFVLGKTMMRVNGLPAKSLNKIREPKFKDKAASDFYKKTVNDYNGLDSIKIKNILSDSYAQTDARAEQVRQARLQPAMREEELDESIIEEKVSDKTETLFAGKIIKTLLSSDELIPLKGNREMAAVKNGIMALQAMFSNDMPPLKIEKDGQPDLKAEAAAKDELDGSCIAIVMLYKRLTDSIDALVKKAGSAYPDMAEMLKEFKKSCVKESESFREKTLEYRSYAKTDPQLSNKKLKWMDALKFNRGVFYDLDNDKDLSVTKDGAGASVVYRIERKVPKSDDNPSGKEVVYFRKKDSVPPQEDDELVKGVLSGYKLDKDRRAQYQDLLEDFLLYRKEYSELSRYLKEWKQKHYPPEVVGKNAFPYICKATGTELYATEDDYKIFGQIILELKDAVSKRAIAHDGKNIAAKIDYGRNLSDRNVATSRMATLLGMQSMICESRTATVFMNGKLEEGNLMEDAGGERTSGTKAPYTSKAISQLFQVQIFDFICGQVDRHFGNFHGIKKGNAFDQIKCFDNDMAFGLIKSREVADKTYNRMCPVTYAALLGLPKSVINRIISLDRPYIEQVMGDILNKNEIDAVMDRLNYVKYCITVIGDDFDNVKWDGKKKKLTYKKEFEDDEYRTLFALKKTINLADNNDIDLDELSKFRPDNVKLTQVDSMMKRRLKLIKK